MTVRVSNRGCQPNNIGFQLVHFHEKMVQDIIPHLNFELPMVAEPSAISCTGVKHFPLAGLEHAGDCQH